MLGDDWCYPLICRGRYHSMSAPDLVNKPATNITYHLVGGIDVLSCIMRHGDSCVRVLRSA